jgi:hypothetical protein
VAHELAIARSALHKQPELRRAGLRRVSCPVSSRSRSPRPQETTAATVQAKSSLAPWKGSPDKNLHVGMLPH